jgi:hypothetical protein
MRIRRWVSVCFARSIEEPLRNIVENAGEDAAVILNQVKAGKGAYEYNAATGEFRDMPEEGILDPTKVTRLALQGAPNWQFGPRTMPWRLLPIKHPRATHQKSAEVTHPTSAASRFQLL